MTNTNSKTSINRYKDSINVIDSAHFVDDEDMSFLSTTMEKIQHNWEKGQRFRTETEMNVSVLDSLHFPTHASQYWQCVREQGVMYGELVRGSFELRKTNLKIKKIEKKMGSLERADTVDEFKLEELQINIEEKLFEKINIEATLKDRIRELKMWDGKMTEIKSKADFDSEDVNTHQLVSYALRFERQLQLLKENSEGSSIGEIQNLVGQFNTTMMKLETEGLFSPEYPNYVENQGLSKEKRLEIAESNRIRHAQEALEVAKVSKLPIENAKV